ncbi:MAG: integration host factor subunit alpha [Myxococcales bacterium]|nr:integration host factor subunit alpha [Myxococcales bacterium]
MNTEVNDKATVTKAQIIDVVHQELQMTGNREVTKRESAELVECVFRTLKSEIRSLRDQLDGESEKFEADATIKPERRLKISGFGNFIIRYKRSRPGRNPQNNKKITISSRYVLTFKPSAVLKKAINDVSK